MRSRSVAFAVITGILLLSQASAASAAPAQTFANCTEMHKVYKGGVAKPGARDARASGRARYAPKVSLALYTANTKSDRDKDGIACER